MWEDNKCYPTLENSGFFWKMHSCYAFNQMSSNFAHCCSKSASGDHKIQSKKSPREKRKKSLRMEKDGTENGQPETGHYRLK